MNPSRMPSPHCSPAWRVLLLLLLVAIFSAAASPATAQEQCVADAAFHQKLGSPPADSCCQDHVCGLPCPRAVPAPPGIFTVFTFVAIAVSFAIGLSTYFVVKGRATNFFVAGRSLPLVVVAVTLAAQSIDSNALLGNVDFSYKFHFFDGAVIPIGLGLSLIINAVFFAGPINRDLVLTLPDVFAKRYGPVVEVLVSIASTVSFLFLLAGNLVGMGLILSYVSGLSQGAGVWISTAVVWMYTATGGLFSVAYTDLVQGAVGWIGCLVTAFWFIHNSHPSAPPPSRGFPSYIYPDVKGTGGVCDLYSGIACGFDVAACCFNGTGTTDNGAFPLGDKRVFNNQMFSPSALSPFPNAILWNWATIFILGFGNLAALDFQARCMASKTPRTATIGCFIGGCLTFLVGIPFAYLGSITRVFYGPDSPHAEFNADSCSTLLGLPTCAEWKPDPSAFLHLLTNQAPRAIGVWCLIGLISASMSTSDGAILALGTVFSHNIVRQLERFKPGLLTGNRLLFITRLSTLPFAAIAGAIAAFSPGVTGKLLIVAFDVVLATVVVPLFGCFYTKNPSSPAALLSFLTGAVVRIVLEFTLAKDGSFLLPYSMPEFLNFGPAASLSPPPFIDSEPGVAWDPAVEKCAQNSFRDYTGIDSLSAFAASLVVFVIVQMLDNSRGRPLFRFPGDVGYEKDLGEEVSDTKAEDKSVNVELGTNSVDEETAGSDQ